MIWTFKVLPLEKVLKLSFARRSSGSCDCPPDCSFTTYSVTPSSSPLRLTFLTNSDITPFFWAGLATQETWPLAPCAPWRGSSPFHGWRVLWKHTPLQKERFHLSSLKWKAGQETVSSGFLWKSKVLSSFPWKICRLRNTFAYPEDQSQELLTVPVCDSLMVLSSNPIWHKFC